MKTKTMIAGLLLVSLGIPFTDTYAQGGLTPPGAPAPTMKTLDQLEPRTPINAATTISQSGSYYLTSNIEVSGGDGIVIDADEVSLDLNGFTIRSTAPVASGTGIRLNGMRHNISIFNGFIVGGVTRDSLGVFSGPGFDSGIRGEDVTEIRVSTVLVRGCLNEGIYISRIGSVVEGCYVETVGYYGILATIVRSSVADDCGYTAISANQVSDSVGITIDGGWEGIDARMVNNSFGYCRRESSSATGISAGTVENSFGDADTSEGKAYGIWATSVHNSFGSAESASGSATGISASIVQNSYGGTRSESGSAMGINASIVQSCRGWCYVAQSEFPAYGILAEMVHLSYGECSAEDDTAGYGISAFAVSNCRGYSERNHSASRGIETEGPANDSFAYCSAGTALEAESASNSRGESTDGRGIDAERNAINCVGISGSEYGLYAITAQNCYGVSKDSSGLYAITAQNCYGESTSGSGLHASTAQNCRAKTTEGTGLYANTAETCYGVTTSGSYGLYASSMGIGCIGSNGGSGIGIHGYILNTCVGSNSSGPSVSATHKYNMP